MSPKYCFMNKERPCDLTCKAAFETEDPVENVDCYFIWLSHQFGEGLFEMRRVLEAFGGSPFPFPPGGSPGPDSPGGGPGGGGPGGFDQGPKGSKGFPNN